MVATTVSTAVTEFLITRFIAAVPFGIALTKRTYETVLLDVDGGNTSSKTNDSAVLVVLLYMPQVYSE
ncbi:hypothetical protein D3C86_1820880 [compost metagenome]